MKPNSRPEHINRKSIISKSIRVGWIPFSLIILFAVISAAITGVAPLVFGEAFQQLMQGDGNIAISFSGMRLLIILGIAALVIQGISTILKKFYNRSFLEYWVLNMSRKIARMDYAKLTSMDTGNINRRMTKELNLLTSYFNEYIGNILNTIIVIVFAIYMLFKLKPVLTFVIVGSMIVIVPLGILIMKLVKKFMKRIVEIWSYYEGASTDYIASQFQIRSFNAETRMIKHIQTRLTEVYGINGYIYMFYNVSLNSIPEVLGEFS